MTKEVIASSSAPIAIGPFSQAILSSAKYHLELSGQLGMNPVSGKLVEGGIEAETRQTLKNIEAVLAELGWNLQNIIKTRIYLADINDYAKVNEIYATNFEKDPPARIALAVKDLPLGALIEIECVAAGDGIS